MKIEWGQHITVVGTVGSGKTFFNRNAILPAYSRAIILDSEEDDYADFPMVSVERALALAKSDYAFIVRVPTEGVLQLDEDTLESLCRGLLQKGHELLLLIEECTDYSDTQYIPPYLRSLMRRARHRKISVAASTQRLQELSRDYFSLSVHHVYFFMSDADAAAPTVSRYAPFLQETLREIPYLSYKSIYQEPDGSIVLLDPVSEYDWTSRLKK